MPNGDPQCEYTQLAENMRHYGNMRFGQLTIFVAVAGGLLAALFSRESPAPAASKLALSTMGLLATLVFWVMEERSATYWHHYRRRAEELEQILAFRQYTCLPLGKLRGLVTATNAARLLYGSVLAFWFLVAVGAICGCSQTVGQFKQRSAPETASASGEGKRNAGRDAQAPVRVDTAPRLPKTPGRGTPFMVVPGKSLGPIRLGMNADEAIAAGARAWGEEPEVDRRLGTVIHWQRLDVGAFVASDSEGIWKAATTSPKFRTSGGIGVGSSYSAAKKRLGKPYDYSKIPSMGATAAWSSGLVTNLSLGGAVLDIQVVPRGGAR